MNEPAERSGIGGRSRFQLYMTHEFAGTLQEAGWVLQSGALKEADVDVGGEHIDICEGHVSETRNRATVMQKLADFVSAVPHHLKPLLRDGSQFTWMFAHPRIDGGIAWDGAVESQQFRFLDHASLAFESCIHSVRKQVETAGEPNPKQILRSPPQN